MVLFSRLMNVFMTFWTFLFGGNNGPNTSPTISPTKVPVMAPAKVPSVTVTDPVPVIPVNRPVSSPVRVPPPVPISIPTAKSPTSRTPTRVPSKIPSKQPPTKTPVLAPIHTGQWMEVNPNATITKRHEACFVMVNGLAYLLGGRGRKVMDVYDPKTKIWIQQTGPPIELHHTQCVAVPADDQIYIVSAWTGGYPMERNVDMIYIYNILNDTWTTRDGLPESRRRGGAASVLVGRKIYVSHGNRGGHETGNFSTSYGWLDYYHIDTNTWVTDLPDAPHPRDHTGGAFINNRYICVAGGRDSGNVGFFDRVVLPTDCFDIQTNTWSVEANIPQGRAGSSYGRTCDGKYLIVAGGEGFGRAWDDVDAFDGTSWIKWDSLNIGRHGSGLAVDCTQNSPCRNQIHIASGAAGQGGGREITSVETYFPNGVVTACNN